MAVLRHIRPRSAALSSLLPSRPQFSLLGPRHAKNDKRVHASMVNFVFAQLVSNPLLNCQMPNAKCQMPNAKRQTPNAFPLALSPFPTHGLGRGTDFGLGPRGSHEVGRSGRRTTHGPCEKRGSRRLVAGESVSWVARAAQMPAWPCIVCLASQCARHIRRLHPHSSRRPDIGEEKKKRKGA